MRSIVRSIRTSPLLTANRRLHLKLVRTQILGLARREERRPVSSTLSTRQTLDINEKKDVDKRLQMTFTCTAGNCGHRSTHEFSARAYNTGIVLLTCPSCKNRHLIADHIGWFKESTENGKFKTVEDLLKARGEHVTRGRLGADGDIAYYPGQSEELSKDS